MKHKITQICSRLSIFILMIEWVIDIGNTDLVVGIWQSHSTDPQSFRLKIKTIKEDSTVFKYFFEKLLETFPSKSDIKITLSSVVPEVTKVVLDILESEFTFHPILLNSDTFKHLPLVVLKPDEIGTDLVANALAAHLRYHTYSIVVDFGTALSFTTLDPNGKILGVSIAPGLQTAIKSLTTNAAQLYEVLITQPDSALGLDTEHAIQAGITYGYDGLVKGIILAQEKEIGQKLNVICTGGLSQIIKTLDQRVDHFLPFLTLEGLRAAGKLIRGNMG